MPLYALVDGARTRATKMGPRRAACDDCGADMRAKTGDVVVAHWAHVVAPESCISGGEGEWHLGLKDDAIDGTQEIRNADGTRRADILAPGGYAVELQHSHMDRAEVAAREKDWDHNLVWIFDGIDAAANGNIITGPVAIAEPGSRYRRITWKWAPDRVTSATCRTLIDLDGNWFMFMRLWNPKDNNVSGRHGYGWVMSRQWVTDNVLCGAVLPDPPELQDIIRREQLEATERKAAQLRQVAWQHVRDAQERRAAEEQRAAQRRRVADENAARAAHNAVMEQERAIRAEADAVHLADVESRRAADEARTRAYRAERDAKSAALRALILNEAVLYALVADPDPTRDRAICLCAERLDATVISYDPGMPDAAGGAA